MTFDKPIDQTPQQRLNAQSKAMHAPNCLTCDGMRWRDDAGRFHIEHDWCEICVRTLKRWAEAYGGTDA